MDSKLVRVGNLKIKLGSKGVCIMRTFAICITVVLGGVLSGCATNIGVKNGPIHFGKTIDLTMRPEQSLGVRVTPALEEGNVTVIEAPISDSQIGGEMYPGRISFPGWARNDEGKEGFAQYILAGNYKSCDFMSFVIIDGVFSDMRSAKILPLSSRTEYTWDQDGMPVLIDRIRFYDEEEYRAELVEKYGVSIGSRHLVKGFDKTVKSWNRYATEHGDIYSPLSEEDIERVAKINPGYSPIEKLILRNRAVISINPYQVVATASITVFEAMTKKSQGWDIGSEVSRMQMAMTFAFTGRFCKEIAREQREEIVKKDAEIAELKKQKEADSAKAVSVESKPTLQPVPQTKKIKVVERRRR
ncbi:MAG: hypothetical protein ACD_8C00104G0003 [uncultured bacterium]|nr:MAG: hypothetical protein ACD_8C00104G0003 [uncultured bacterium]